MTEPRTSIDDLLGHEEEPARRAGRQRDGARWWLRAVLLAAAATLVVFVALRLFGVSVSGPAVFVGFLALLLLRRIAGQLTPPQPARSHPSGNPDRHDGGYNWNAPDALGSSVSRWERKLVWSQGEPERFGRGVQPLLADLVDERLRQRHGLTPGSDPERARALLGDPLWKLLTEPVKRTPAPRDLAAIVANLEKL